MQKIALACASTPVQRPVVNLEELGCFRSASVRLLAKRFKHAERTSEVD